MDLPISKPDSDPTKIPDPKNLKWTISLLEKINTQIYDLNFKLSHTITDEKIQVPATVELRLVRGDVPDISLMREDLLLKKDSLFDEFKLSQFANLDLVNQVGNQLILTVSAKEDIAKHGITVVISNPKRIVTVTKGVVQMDASKLWPSALTTQRDIEFKYYSGWFEDQIIDDTTFATQAEFTARFTPAVPFRIELCRPRAFDGLGPFCVDVESPTPDKLREALRQLEPVDDSLTTKPILLQLVFSFKSTGQNEKLTMGLSLFDSCKGNPCGSNKVKCTAEKASKPTCKCNPGYKGDRCEINTLQACDASRIVSFFVLLSVSMPILSIIFHQQYLEYLQRIQCQV